MVKLAAEKKCPFPKASSNRRGTLVDDRRSVPPLPHKRAISLLLRKQFFRSNAVSFSGRTVYRT